MDNKQIKVQKLHIAGIPALVWGGDSPKVYVHVHGKMSRKEFARDFAVIAEEKGYQTLSFDLPEHGERSGERGCRCDIWNGPRDLGVVADHAFAHWTDVCLFGSSLGAFFSLHAYRERPFEKCLFQSPVVDMEHLVEKMMVWFGITEEELREKGEVPNPIDPLRWDYYQYVKAHPVTEWKIPTSILYGGRDGFQSREVIERFAQAHGCDLMVAPDSEHAFMAEEDGGIINDWYRKKI